MLQPSIQPGCILVYGQVVAVTISLSRTVITFYLFVARYIASRGIARILKKGGK